MNTTARKAAAAIAEAFKRTGEIESAIDLAEVIDRTSAARVILRSIDPEKPDQRLRQAIWSFLRGEDGPLAKYAEDIIACYGGAKPVHADYALRAMTLAERIQKTLPHFSDEEK